ncbi:ig-like domain-containing protein [Caerostris darwini]|uniref:Ig-like domain-containing protein n=1 Tax=Caerostris darwini TaxID=1538125 RepID=A0AAV4UP77_9ARAC|nr:ig-like domain-containing protein [Caerostris darwini]
MKCSLAKEAGQIGQQFGKILPTEGPSITGGRSKYRIGDTVYVNCTSSKSKPAATLRWYINDELATVDNELEHSTTLHSDGLETSSLSLKFMVNELHFRRGNMKLKCTATISRVYTMSNEELVFGTGLRQQASGLHITEKSSHGET